MKKPAAKKAAAPVKAKAVAKVGNPPVSGPAALMNKPVSVIPGSLTAYDAKQGQNKFGATYQINPDINAYIADINESERRISRAFYEDLFRMLSQSDRRQITAR